MQIGAAPAFVQPQRNGLIGPRQAFRPAIFCCCCTTPPKSETEPATTPTILNAPPRSGFGVGSGLDFFTYRFGRLGSDRRLSLTCSRVSMCIQT